MLVSEAMTQINMAYRGSDDDVPVAATPDYILWLGTINRKIQEFAKDEWSSLFNYDSPNEPGTVTTVGTTALTGTGTYFTDYQVGDKITVLGETERTIATITSDTALTVTLAFANSTTTTFTHKNIIKSAIQTYNQHRNFNSPADEVIVYTTSDHIFTLGKPQARDQFENQTYIHGGNPKQITFVDDIASTSEIIGGTVIVPGYYAPDALTLSTETIPVDDPYWLVYSVASELAFNDLTYESKAGALNSKANSLYQAMRLADRKGTAKQPRIVPTQMYRITGF